MPRKKIEISPLEEFKYDGLVTEIRPDGIYEFEGLIVEIMPDGWDLKGHGSNNKKKFQANIDKMVLKMIDDFVDNKTNKILPQITTTNGYLKNATAFAIKVDRYGLATHLETDQQLRRRYYPIVKKEIERNIQILINSSSPLEKLLEYSNKVQ